MTIISHQHRFIFIKTMKTAGTAIEHALAASLAPQDVFSSGAVVHADGFDRRNHRKSALNQFRLADLAAVFHGVRDDLAYGRRSNGRRGRWRRPLALRQHASADEIRAFVGDEIWFRYSKVCFERNPWDRMISYYVFRKQNMNLEISFKEWLEAALVGSKRMRRLHCADYVRNYPLYTLDGEIAVDSIFRYEDLPDAFYKLAGDHGLRGLELQRLNAGVRGAKLSETYDDEMASMVANALSKEVSAGGYKYEPGNS